MQKPAAIARGDCTQKMGLCNAVSFLYKLSTRNLTQPNGPTMAPAITAPSDTPTVKPELTRPINSPLRALLVSSITRITLRGRMPAAPMPVMALPRRKVARSVAREVRKAPSEKIIVEMKTQCRGENVCERRPERGVKLDIAIYRPIQPGFGCDAASRSSCRQLG